MTIANHAITVLRRLLDGLLLALVAVSLGILLLGRVIPALGHPTLVVTGPSMGTAIPVGSAVVLDQVPASNLAVGDIVSLRSGPARAVFTHRIIRIADSDGAPSLETKGDANATADPSLTPTDAVLGRVAVAIPYAGYLVTLYSAPSGVLFVISLGLVLFLFGVLLEETDARRGPVPASRPREGIPSHVPLAPVAQVATFERPTLKEVVVASRQRRARRARWSADGSPHPRHRA